MDKGRELFEHHFEINDELKTNIIRLDSFEELIDLNKKIYLEKGYVQENIRVDMENDDRSWSGFDGAKDLFEKAENGIHEYTDKLFKIEEEITETIGNSTHTEFVMDVEGDFFDVGAVVIGEPEHWFREIEVEGKPKVVINYSPIVSSSVNHETIFNKGACCVALIKELQALGYDVDLNIVFVLLSDTAQYKNHFMPRRGRKYGYKTQCEIKIDVETLDISRLAFVLCATAMSRGLLFGICAFDGLMKYQLKGIKREMSRRDLNGSLCVRDERERFAKDVLFESSLNSEDKFSTMSKCVEFVKKKIKELTTGKGE